MVEEFKKEAIKNLVLFGAVVSLFIFVVNKIGMSVGSYIVFAFTVVNPVTVFLIKVITYVISVTVLYYAFKIFGAIFVGFKLVRSLSEIIKERLGK